ncbi:TIMELESS-interacting protein [Zerene cesonia]|uniref:TIMELESS-interacting protein n=1 Tax=Zerene cesonia TaxID=33412 RepID=UPI0018E50CCF|nr:TIMELESS-interacting protein [Zerene cesonia]
MSLLEDVFLQDEANEAQELERVIEGGDYDERLPLDSDDNSEKEDEAEEDKRRVDPTSNKSKRIVKNPRFILNPARLTGPRGIQVIPEHFKDFKFKGKGHEKEDLDLVLKKLEHWAYRLYPKFKFEDCLKKIEVLGKKRPVMVHLQKIRSDQFISEETVVQKDSSDDEAPQQEEDEFDKLLQQQIDLARATPAPGSVKKNMVNSRIEDRSLSMPKATSSPSISEEQRERMLRNRRLAEERRLAKLKTNNSDVTPNIEGDDDLIAKKHTKANVIDSSDEESENVSVCVHQEVRSKNNRNEVNTDMDTFDNLRHNSDEEITKLDENGAANNEVAENNNKTDKSKDQKQVQEGAAEESKEKDNIDAIDEDTNDASDTDNVTDNQENIVLENSILQSTIQGLVENDNNINLERDLINQDFVEDEISRVTDNADVNVDSNQKNNNKECENVMDVDFSEEF